MANTKALELIDIAARYHHIKPVPRMPNFAAWIEGVDLTQPLSKPVQTELRQALFDFEVIFFRPQVITPKQHIALANVFGPLSSGSYFDRHPSVPELEVITSDPRRPPAIDNWHTDISWKPNPPLGTAIQITVTPPAGGNTCWISTSTRCKCQQQQQPPIPAHRPVKHSFHFLAMPNSVIRSEIHFASSATRLFICSALMGRPGMPALRNWSCTGLSFKASIITFDSR